MASQLETRHSINTNSLSVLLFVVVVVVVDVRNRDDAALVAAEALARDDDFVVREEAAFVDAATELRVTRTCSAISDLMIEYK